MNLFGMSTISEEDRKSIAKKELNNLLTSYADEADVFAEVLQNAFDAVMEAIKQGLYANEAPSISVVIGRRSTGKHYLFVVDNGIGMSKEVAEKVTVPGFSHGKRKGKTVGYKGVGASYFFAASQRASLRTVDKEGSCTEYTVRGSYDWITSDEEPEPQVEWTSDVPESVRHLLPEKRGTSIFFQFHDGIKPRNLNNLVLVGEGPTSELKNWACFLASKTALGSVESHKPKNIKVVLMLDLGDSLIEQSWSVGDFNREEYELGYPFPHRVFRQAKCIDEINSTPPEQKWKHDRKHAAVYKRWTPEEMLNELKIDTEERERLIELLAWVEGYFCYSTDVLKVVNERMGGRGALVRHGIRIAVDGIPQGRTVDLSLTSSQGLDRQTHIVIAFKGLDLDTGRKISSDEVIASAISRIGQRVVGILKEFRWAMKKKDRPDITSDLDSWKSQIDDRSNSSLVRELFKRRSLPSVFRVDPANESEVIALFVSLVTHSLIKGYQVQAISGFARYDSLTDVDSENSDVRDLDDTLSARGEIELNGVARVLEFKYSFDELLRDFDDKSKNPSEIDFVVCWTLPDVSVSRGRIEPTYGKWKDGRTIYAASHIWIDENETSKIPIIALRNVVAELLAITERELDGEIGLGGATLATLEAQDRDALV